MTKEATQKIPKLNERLKSLQKERDTLNEATEQWADRRDKINRQLKDLRLQARKTKEQRDTLNERVKAHKAQRDEIRNDIKEKIKEVKQLKKKLQLLATKKPNIDENTLKKEKEDIEWKIQTSSLTLQEEKSLVEKANQLGAKLGTHRKIHDIQDRLQKLRIKIDDMKKEADLLHETLEEIANQSQELHVTMIEKLENARSLQAEADEYHQEFLQNKAESWKIHQEIITITKQVRTLKKHLIEIADKNKKKQQKEAREKLREETLEKLKKGHKLSLDEFKILAEEEST